MGSTLFCLPFHIRPGIYSWHFPQWWSGVLSLCDNNSWLNFGIHGCETFRLQETHKVFSSVDQFIFSVSLTALKTSISVGVFAIFSIERSQLPVGFSLAFCSSLSWPSLVAPLSIHDFMKLCVRFSEQMLRFNLRWDNFHGVGRSRYGNQNKTSSHDWSESGPCWSSRIAGYLGNSSVSWLPVSIENRFPGRVSSILHRDR